MAQPTIAPLIPNAGPLAEAIAGTQAATFTATDRQLIKELGGEINRKGSFKEIFSNKGLLPKVENEETSVQPKQDLTIIEKRQRERQFVLKHSTSTIPQEQVRISEQEREELPSRMEINAQDPVSENKSTARKINQETAALIKELNLNPFEMYEKFSLEQDELHSLICRIKDLHLKRLLCGSQKEFEELSDKIKKETLQSSLPEARPWLEEQLNLLTQSAAEYKQKLSESLKKFQ